MAQLLRFYYHKQQFASIPVLFSLMLWFYYSYHMGIKHLADEEYSLAIQSFTKTLNFQPEQMQVYIHRAEAFLQMADFQSAILNVSLQY